MVAIFENSWKGGRRFSSKNGRVVHIGEKVIYKGRGKHYFSWKYGFFCKNALYSTSLLLTMFIFLITPIDTWDCYYFNENYQSGDANKRFCLKKSMSHFVFFQTWKNYFPSWDFFLYLSHILLKQYCQKHAAKKRVFMEGNLLQTIAKLWLKTSSLKNWNTPTSANTNNKNDTLSITKVVAKEENTCRLSPKLFLKLLWIFNESYHCY